LCLLCWMDKIGTTAAPIACPEGSLSSLPMQSINDCNIANVSYCHNDTSTNVYDMILCPLGHGSLVIAHYSYTHSLTHSLARVARTHRCVPPTCVNNC
jgi:hypothetical protein